MTNIVSYLIVLPRMASHSLNRKGSSRVRSTQLRERLEKGIQKLGDEGLICNANEAFKNPESMSKILIL